MKKYKVAVVGAGAVGQEMVRILNKRRFPLEELRLLARSARRLEIDGKTYQVQETTAASFDGIDIALFAGTEGEKGAAVTFGQEAVSRGAVVIDNGSDYRMDPKVPLVVPEINGEALKDHKGIIANPNCTTAVLLMALGPLHRAFGVKRAVVSTYQAVSGAGAKAVTMLRQQAKEVAEGQAPSDLGGFPGPIAFNVLANGWTIEDQGYSNEEWKAVKESKKILSDDSIRVTITTVRVPTVVGHGESLWVEFDKAVSPQDVRALLEKAPGVRVVDEKAPFKGSTCPSPQDAEGEEDVLVGRIRQDVFDKNAVALWVVGDNLLKGAALNAVQIAETLAQKGWVSGQSASSGAARS